MTMNQNQKRRIKSDGVEILAGCTHQIVENNSQNFPKKTFWDKKQQTPAKATRPSKKNLERAKKPNKIIPRNRFDNKPEQTSIKGLKFPISTCGIRRNQEIKTG